MAPAARSPRISCLKTLKFRSSMTGVISDMGAPVNAKQSTSSGLNRIHSIRQADFNAKTPRRNDAKKIWPMRIQVTKW